MQESSTEEITHEDLLASGLIGGRWRKGKKRKIRETVENWLYKRKTTS